MIDKPLGAVLKLFIVNISLENVLHTCHYKENKNIQHTYTYVSKLMHTPADTVFYKNCVLTWLHTTIGLKEYNLCYMKCGNYISGLHILASNNIPESILNADVLSKILHGISQYLLKENTYSLLYGSAVNAYYNMRIFQEFHY